jgi:predicted RNA-binding Zn ribbon-like protein
MRKTRPAAPKKRRAQPFPPSARPKTRRSPVTTVLVLGSPASRLRYLLAIAQGPDVEQLPDAAANALTAGLHNVYGQRQPSRAALAAGFRELREWFRNLVAQRSHEVLLTPKSRASLVYLVTEGGGLERRFIGDFSAALVDAAADLLQRVGVDRLRACPLPLTQFIGPRCGQLFIAERRQTYCTTGHARAQARREWRRKQRLTQRSEG